MVLCLALMMPAMAGRPKIGLALGGGGAKGAAEVGVLKVLEEAGIHVDYIVGTSIGSIVGGLYAAGYTATELETMFQTQEWLTLLTDRKASLANEPYTTVDGVTYVFGFPIRDRQSKGFGVMKGGQIEHLLDSMASRSGSEVILREGGLAQAMRASMAIPGVFKPVDRGDYKLVDGGMLNNLPVDVCREMGADIVIAVDLQQNDQKPRQQTDLSMFSAIADLLGVGGILNWILNRPDIEKYITNRQQADILIRPYLPDYDITSFGNKIAARMIQSGADATRQLLPQIHALEK